MLGAKAVAVQHGSLHQPCHGLQPGVRVRADIQACGLSDLGRPHVVGEAPRTDRAQPPTWKDAPHLHPTHVGRDPVVHLDRHAPSVAAGARTRNGSRNPVVPRMLSIRAAELCGAVGASPTEGEQP